MQAILKTNDPVQLQFAQALLTDAGIGHAVFDDGASAIYGSMGMLPRRLMVADGDVAPAIALLRDGLDGYSPP
jgi:hypothetical protein